MGSIVDEIFDDQPKHPPGTVHISLASVLQQNDLLRARVEHLVAEATESRRLAVEYQKLYHQAAGLCVDTSIPPRSYTNLPQHQSMFTSTAPALIRVFRWPWERKPCRR